MQTLHISFLLSAFCITCVFGQSYTEGFDDGDRSLLIDACWMFSSTSVRTSDGNGNLINGPSVRTGQLTNMANPHKFGTPCTEFNGTGTISFQHYVHSLAGSSLKRLDLVRVDANRDVDVDTLLTFEYTHTNLTESVINIDFSGEYKIEWRWIGSGGIGRAWIDDVQIGGGNMADPDNGCGCKSSSLPLEWIDISLTSHGSSSFLNWTTAHETNTSHFDIERSEDGRMFQRVGRVEAVGNRRAMSSYSFEDKTSWEMSSKEIFFRIKQVDLNGEFSYSSLLSVDVLEAESGMEVFPNPASDWLSLHIYQQDQSTGNLIIRNLMGNVIWIQSVSSEEKTCKISIEDWIPGVYVVSLQTDVGVLTEKITVQ